jgi:hypothetical protein
MLSALAPVATLVLACTGPYCAPDTDFERPTLGAMGTAGAPALAVAPDGAALLLWESRVGGESDILFSRRESGPDGRWLAEPIRLDTDPPGTSRSIEPRLATGPEGRIYAAWQDGRNGKDDILFSSSIDGGLGWSKEIRLGATAAGVSSASMAALAAGAGGHVFVTWEDTRDGERDVYLARSLDFGSTWDERRINSGEQGASASYHPQIVAADDGTLLVVWWDERHGLSDLYVRWSGDFGATWNPEVRLDSGEPGAVPSRDARVALSGDRVVIAWQEAPDDPFATLVSRTSEDRGASWGEIREIGRGRHPFPVVIGDHSPCFAWLVAQRAGPAEKTSIGGRIREMPQPVRLQAMHASAEGPGREVQVLSSLTGPASLWLGAAPDRIWAVRTGTLVGRAALEVFENPGDQRWSSAIQLTFGLDLVTTDVEITAHSLRGAVSADGVVHIAWVADYDGVGDLGYFRLQPSEDR